MTMRAQDSDLIRTLPLFHDMSGELFEELIHAAFLQRFPAHVVLIKEGELPDFLHVTVEGAVELFATYEGSETTIDILRPITTFILAAVIQDDVYLKSARTLMPARVLMIPAPAVRSVFGRDANFARAVVSELALRYRSIVRELKNQKLRTGLERLANWILQTDIQTGGTGRFELAYDKRTIAALLGMTPENLSRNLATLAADCIASETRAITIVDRDRLVQIARPDPLIDVPRADAADRGFQGERRDRTGLRASGAHDRP
jgi:CRP/FNR family transcriptional activator FtrB